MQRFLQVLFFIGIISAVFASSGAPTGCHEGKVWTLKHETKCSRCECHDNRMGCFDIPQPCEDEGSALEFFTYGYIPEPPTGRFTGLTDGPSNPWTGTTQPSPNYDDLTTATAFLPEYRNWRSGPIPTPKKEYFENPAYKK